MNTRQFNTQIAKLKKLPPLSEASNLIMAAVNDPDISIEELVAVLSASPVLVGRLLGLANSAYFGRPEEINDLRIAIIQVLGLNMVKSLALSLVLEASLDVKSCKLFNAQRFWSNALLTAILAQKLSLLNKTKNIDAAFVYTSGLLLNIGLLAAIFILPKEMDDVFASEQESDTPLRQHMLDQIGVDQYFLGFLLLERWQLPSSYQSILKQFNNADFQGEELEIIKLIKFSSKIASQIYYDKKLEGQEIVEELQYLQVSENQLKGILQDILEKLGDLRKLASTLGGK